MAGALRISVTQTLALLRAAGRGQEHHDAAEHGSQGQAQIHDNAQRAGGRAGARDRAEQGAEHGNGQVESDDRNAGHGETQNLRKDAHYTLHGLNHRPMGSAELNTRPIGAGPLGAIYYQI